MKHLKHIITCITLILISLVAVSFTEHPQKKKKTRKAVFIIVDGISADVIEKLNPPVLAEISRNGKGFTRAYVGGERDGYSQTPTISAVGYNSLLTGTWVHKHNVWDNDIVAPNYNYWSIFRVAKKAKPDLTTAIFSTWLDNRTKLVGEGLQAAGNLTMTHKFDGFENDTTRFPHDKDKLYIHKIDEIVAEEAGRYIAEKGPDLSWVYLEYTDDMGHRHGDSQKFHDAILTADKQIGKVWEAIKKREKENNEEWLIVITTDHGRDAQTGKGHGGQSDRERLTWIVTNAPELNPRFQQSPGIVDIMPSICNFMNIPIPEEVKEEIDAVPFIGKVSVANVKAVKADTKIQLTWKNLADNKTEKAAVFIATSNKFKEGGKDVYKKIGEVSLTQEKFEIDVQSMPSKFYKVLLKAPGNYGNAWVIEP